MCDTNSKHKRAIRPLLGMSFCVYIIVLELPIMIRSLICSIPFIYYITHHRKPAGSRNSITPIDNWMMVKSDLIDPILSLDEWKETWVDL
ncbi:hypothetical protein KCTCHS21_16640 [Cohnella abietis]|uniref:Uncharacterized protein n=1 Tax=Cohnella abietis TaxID=2507935 RepID=A0A3T1D2N6_9BACL|nr:hypothetical protein KCTCHS21_16640 [Cohnella abietis]